MTNDQPRPRCGGDHAWCQTVRDDEYGPVDSLVQMQPPRQPGVRMSTDQAYREAWDAFTAAVHAGADPRTTKRLFADVSAARVESDAAAMRLLEAVEAIELGDSDHGPADPFAPKTGNPMESA